MNNQDKKEFHKVMLGMCEVHGKNLSEPLLDIYFSALSDLTIEQFKQAASLHLNDKSDDGKFWPKPSTLRSYIEGTAAQVDDDIDNRANLAWLEITTKLRTIGAYGTLEMEDKQAMMAVRSMGTWQSLCHTPLANLDFKRNQFIANYKSLEKTDCSNLQALPGIHELENQRKIGGNSSLNIMVDKLIERMGD